MDGRRNELAVASIGDRTTIAAPEKGVLGDDHGRVGVRALTARIRGKGAWRSAAIAATGVPIAKITACSIQNINIDSATVRWPTAATAGTPDADRRVCDYSTGSECTPEPRAPPEPEAPLPPPVDPIFRAPARLPAAPPVDPFNPASLQDIATANATTEDHKPISRTIRVSEESARRDPKRKGPNPGLTGTIATKLPAIWGR
jgi:hypothetical protein